MMQSGARAILGGILCSAWILGTAQPPQSSLSAFVLQQVAEDESQTSITISEWASRHPGETVDEPAQHDAGYDSANIRERQERELEGRWCLRSTIERELADGIHVRRVALFYQPSVEESYRGLPALPTERGSALRQHGCGLTKVLYELDGNNALNAVESIAKQMPGQRSDEPGRFIQETGDYWQPKVSFDAKHFYYFFIHRGATGGADAGSVLLEWEKNTLKYGPPSEKSINPEADQPWLAMRAAMLAGLPEDPTLKMLAFLAPEVGDHWEQPLPRCRRLLVPLLREWMQLAKASPPQRHAAALLLADAVGARIEDCAEFSYSQDPIAQGEENGSDALRSELKMLGMETDEMPRVGNEYYTGNLLAQVRRLAPEGQANELYWMAVLNNRCRWSQIEELDCTKFIQQGEKFLKRFPHDEWTPSVHLLMAEAYSLSAACSDESEVQEAAGFAMKAEEHYRAWFARSTNERDRTLVWQEIWGLDAGLGPWLQLPSELH